MDSMFKFISHLLLSINLNKNTAELVESFVKNNIVKATSYKMLKDKQGENINKNKLNCKLSKNINH